MVIPTICNMLLNNFYMHMKKVSEALIPLSPSPTKSNCSPATSPDVCQHIVLMNSLQQNDVNIVAHYFNKE